MRGAPHLFPPAPDHIFRPFCTFRRRSGSASLPDGGHRHIGRRKVGGGIRPRGGVSLPGAGGRGNRAGTLAPIVHFCGICAKYYLSDSIPVRILYILSCGAGRGIVTAISAAAILNATAGEIFLDIVLPEFFSTALLAPLLYVLVHFAFKPFHKSRAQRTGE